MKLKKTGIVLLILITVAVIVALVSDNIVEGKINKILQKEFGRELQYENLDNNVFFGDLSSGTVSLENEKFRISAKAFQISGFDYWSYFFRDKIEVDAVKIISPKITFLKTKDSISPKKQEKKKFEKNFSIADFSIVDGTLFYLNEEKKDTLLALHGFDFKWSTISFSGNFDKLNPLKTGNYSFSGKDLRYDLVKRHAFGAKEIQLSEEAFVFSDIWIKPKYSKEKYRETIPSERDMYDLEIDSLWVEAPILRIMGEKPVFKSPKIAFDGVHFEIYRDKTLPDDPRKKKMYSQMLRDLDLNLNLKKINIGNTYIKYQERIKWDRPLGTVEFFDLEADILNLTNTGMDSENFPETSLDIRTNFMNTSDLQVEWKFDIGNEMDEFSMSGRSTKIPPEAMNPFFIPAMNIKSKGSIDELYFTIHGNKNTSQIDLKLVYDDFSVDVLKGDGQGKKGIASFFANLILKGSSKNGTGTVEAVQVSRDKTKSFWNFFWKSIFGGLKEAML